MGAGFSKLAFLLKNDFMLLDWDKLNAETKGNLFFSELLQEIITITFVLN